jgi:hypothetical protein
LKIWQIFSFEKGKRKSNLYIGKLNPHKILLFHIHVDV